MTYKGVIFIPILIKLCQMIQNYCGGQSNGQTNMMIQCACGVRRAS